GALPMTHGNGFELHVDNHACMEAMADAVDRAKRFVHFEFYIVAIDDTTRRLLESLLAAHRRGVSVRILIDHVGSLGYPGYSDLGNHLRMLVFERDVAFTVSQSIIVRAYSKRRSLAKGFQWKDVSLECTGPVVG